LHRSRWSRSIRGLGGRAAVISFGRLLNQGLIIISPIVLVRLLSVEDFGRYREFLLYTTFLMNFAALGINSSLLRFVPDRPALKWSYVKQTVLMTFGTSLLVVTVATVLDRVFGGKLLGEFAVEVVIYVLLFANLDFWEFLWLAEKRTFAVIGYTSGRLVARMTTVIVAAALSNDVHTIVWSIIGLEGVRVALSLIGWIRGSRKAIVPEDGASRGLWREQLDYCLPFGASMMVSYLNRAMGSLFVAKAMGPIALAHYSIGTYVQPIVTVVRNSLSDVLLPEMVARERAGLGDRLVLFRRTTVVTSIALIGAGVVLARFAEVIVITLFTEEYRSTIIIFQTYLLVFLRECLDFGIPLRALNQTKPILHANLFGVAVNFGLMFLLVPVMGVMGAVVAFLISRIIEGSYLGWRTMQAYECSVSEIVPWLDLAKILLAASVAALVLYSDAWTSHWGIIGAMLGAVAYFAIFAALLIALRVQEAITIWTYARGLLFTILRKAQRDR
jgi:O-antigen/teichoic acid export membrane protein